MKCRQNNRFLEIPFGATSKKRQIPKSLCVKSVIAPVRPCGNTTNVRNHIKRKHRSVKIGEDAAAAVTKTKVRRTSMSSAHYFAQLVQTTNCDDDIDDPVAYLSDLAQTIVNKVKY